MKSFLCKHYKYLYGRTALFYCTAKTISEICKPQTKTKALNFVNTQDFHALLKTHRLEKMLHTLILNNIIRCPYLLPLVSCRFVIMTIVMGQFPGTKANYQ